jgi:hypothetical protein
MPNPFAISALTNSVKLTSRRQGEASFSVTNISGHQLRAGARIELVTTPQATSAAGGGTLPGAGASTGTAAQPGATAVVAPPPEAVTKWLSFVEEGQPSAPSATPHYTEQDFNIGAIKQFRIHIAVPPDAPGGSQSFYVHFTDVHHQDEEYGDSQIVTFEVPAPIIKKRFPWWILAVAGAAVVIIAAIVAVLALSGSPSPTPTPTATPPTISPTAVVTAAPGANFTGTWLNIETIPGLAKLEISAQGSFLSVHATAVGPAQDWGTRGGTFTNAPFTIAFDPGGGAGVHTLKLTEFENADGKRMLVEETVGVTTRQLVFKNQNCIKLACNIKFTDAEIQGALAGNSKSKALNPTPTPK